MTDPTEFVLTTSFTTALGIFLVSAAIRKLRMRKPHIASEPPSDSAAEASPYATPNQLPSLPPKLLGLVPTWFYRPFDLIGIGIIYLIFFALAMNSVRSAHKPALEISQNGLIASIGFQFMMAGAVVIMVLNHRIKLTEWLGLRWRKWPWVFVIAPAVVLFMWVVFGLLQALGYMNWMESLGVESVQETVKLLQTSKNPEVLALMVFAAVIAAPICEEIVFRGYLYPVAKKFVGPWSAGIFTALVFASAHASLSALLPLFIFGGLLVIVYEKTGSIFAPMAVHFGLNGATVLVQLLVRYQHLPVQAVQ